MSNYVQHVQARTTPQSEPIPGKTMVENSAGGFTFPVDDWVRLERFLILGSEGGTYYATERKLTIENADAVKRCIAADASRTVETIVAVSVNGRAPKNDPAVFALALVAAAGHVDLVKGALPKVCRIGTHIFQFVAAVNALRGWGRGLRKAVAHWYEVQSPNDLAYQIGKYQQRDGWSHRDVLRLIHADPGSDLARNAVYRWAVAGKDGLGERSLTRIKPINGPGNDVAVANLVTQPSVEDHLPTFLRAVDALKSANEKTAIEMIQAHHLPREVIPTEYLKSPAVWGALLKDMPLTALVRNLGKMSSIGLLAPLSDTSSLVIDKLSNEDQIKKSRLHPISILIAGKTYGQGHGDKGKLTWSPDANILAALEGAFYKAFANVVPAGKRTLIALDVSGSMNSDIAGLPITCREGATAMAMVTVKTEPLTHVIGFTEGAHGPGGGHGFGRSGITVLPFHQFTSLQDAVQKTSRLPFGGTDCALPMLYATENNLSVDTFLVITDNETWAGQVHPSQALQAYRRKTGIPAKLVVMAMASNPFSIADPNDAGMLDVVGFDAATPALVADFSRG